MTGKPRGEPHERIKVSIASRLRTGANWQRAKHDPGTRSGAHLQQSAAARIFRRSGETSQRPVVLGPGKGDNRSGGRMVVACAS